MSTVAVTRTDGSIRIDCDGLRDPQTRARLNSRLTAAGCSWQVHDVNGQWFLVHRTRPAIEFLDGIVITADGKLILPAQEA
jgi:hypothetical protein